MRSSQTWQLSGGSSFLQASIEQGMHAFSTGFFVVRVQRHFAGTGEDCVGDKTGLC